MSNTTFERTHQRLNSLGGKPGTPPLIAGHAAAITPKPQSPLSAPYSPTRLPRLAPPNPPVSPPLHLQPETHTSSSTPLNHAPDQPPRGIFIGARWDIGARPRDVSGLSAQGLLVAAAVCLILTAVEGEGCGRLMGTARVVDAAAGALHFCR